MRDLLDTLCFWMIIRGTRWLSPRGKANLQEEMRILLAKED